MKRKAEEFKVRIPVTPQLLQDFLEWRNSQAVEQARKWGSMVRELAENKPFEHHPGVPDAPVQLPVVIENYYGNQKKPTAQAVLLYVDSLAGNRSINIRGKNTHANSFMLVMEPPEGKAYMCLRLYDTISKLTGDRQDNTQSGWSAWTMANKGPKVSHVRNKLGGPGFANRANSLDAECLCLGVCMCTEQDPMTRACGSSDYNVRMDNYRDLFLYNACCAQKSRHYLISEANASKISGANDLAVYLDWFLRPLGGLRGLLKNVPAASLGSIEHLRAFYNPQ